MATKEDIARIARSIIKLRDDRIAQTEAQLTRLADDYRKLRQEMLPLFKQAKERSDPLPYAPHLPQTAITSPEIHQPEISPPPPMSATTQPEKSSLTRTFSKKLGLGSTPKGHSPTHLPNTIHEDRIDHSLNPSAAATAASNQLTAGMSGGAYSQPSPGVPSPTSPMPYQPLAPRSYQRDGGMSSAGYHDDSRSYTAPPYEPPSSAKSATSAGKSTPGHPSNFQGPSRDQTSSAPPGGAQNSSSHSTPSGGQEAPQIEIFKSFKVSLDDPCHKVLPAALHKYNINADWRHYALYIVYGDQERSVALDEKPLALFKELDKEGKKPMFMLRKLGNAPPGPVSGGFGGIPSGAVNAATGAMGGSAAAGLKPPDSGGRSGGMSSAASVRTMATRDPPGGVI
jgi:protein STE50